MSPISDDPADALPNGNGNGNRNRNDRGEEAHHGGSSTTAWNDDRHPDAALEEWVFAAWTADGSLGIVSGHRLVGRVAWYWAALARDGRPLLHITDFDVPVRGADPFIVKGEAMWAEHTREAPMEQWTVGNETYAASLDDPSEALGRAYGDPTPIAFDLEWYATGKPVGLELAPDMSTGYEQSGVVHGAVEILGEPTVELAEVSAHRWHRWSTSGMAVEPASRAGAAAAAAEMAPLPLPEVVAHTGVRAPFRFPDGTSLDLVLTRDGWRRRADRRSR